MDRAEHLQWCKDRAIEYVEVGDLHQAMASMCSDVMKHEETGSHQTTNGLGIAQMMNGFLNTPAKMRKWIEGYN